MQYILSAHYALRGWQRLPYALVDLDTNNVTFLSQERFLLLFHCDGSYEISASALNDRHTAALQEYITAGVVTACVEGDALQEEQRYRQYPARFKESAQWSITGNCNLRCRHCFMSASEAALGQLETEKCLDIVTQMAECGVGKVSLTGGEPLIRRDFWQIVDALLEKNIKITTLFTNGFLINAALLDEFEVRGIRPQIQISFDGIGCHDWLRGIAGAEKAAIAAFSLCRDRGFQTSSALCMNRRNADTLAESVRLLASLGCSGLKVNNTNQAGEWLNESGEYLNDDECFQIYMRYIPQFFADGAPISLMLDGMFAWLKDEGKAFVPYEHSCAEGMETRQLLCAHARRELYISPQGKVLPCMSMAGMAMENHFPNLFETPLREILGDSAYMEYVDTRLDAYLHHNPMCSRCEYRLRCCGGCRALATANNEESLLFRDARACSFFKNGWAERIEKYFDTADKKIVKQCDNPAKTC